MRGVGRHLDRFRVEPNSPNDAFQRAAIGKTIPFSAGDIRRAIGDPNAEVTSVLQKLVADGKLLPPTGKKRWTRYRVAPV